MENNEYANNDPKLTSRHSRLSSAISASVPVLSTPHHDGSGASLMQKSLQGEDEDRSAPLVNAVDVDRNGDDNIGEDYLLPSGSSTSSTPQLFRIASTQRAQQGEGTWEWWYEQVENLRITQDNVCRERLQDIQNRLVRQYDTDKGRVELDLGWCYMERSAPYVLGRLLASPFLDEIRWVTSLRFDGNYFTDEGFGNMLAVMGATNEKTTVLPLLKNLYLNNMNLDPCSIHGILFYLFPLDQFCASGQENRRTIAGKHFGFPVEAYVPFYGAPRAPLFPALEVLSLCDNPSLGNHGVAEILRCFVAPHHEKRVLSILDLSRCGVDEVGVRHIREYLAHLPLAEEGGERIVVADRIVLFGNRHSNTENNNNNMGDDTALSPPDSKVILGS